MTVVPVLICAFGTVSKRFWKKDRKIWKSEEDSRPSLIRSAWIPMRSPGDLRRLVLTLSPMKDHRLKLAWKTLKRVGDRDETIDHIISKCSKLTEKDYKTRHDWVGKAIHWESCKKFKFDYTNKWYMHNPTSVLVVILAKERHGDHKKVDRKTYIYTSNRNKIQVNTDRQ